MPTRQSPGEAVSMGSQQTRLCGSCNAPAWSENSFLPLLSRRPVPGTPGSPGLPTGARACRDGLGTTLLLGRFRPCRTQESSGSVGGDRQLFELPRDREDDPLADIGHPVGNPLQVVGGPEQVRCL